MLDEELVENQKRLTVAQGLERVRQRNDSNQPNFKKPWNFLKNAKSSKKSNLSKKNVKNY